MPDQTPEKVPENLSNPFADAFEANAEKKPEIDCKKEIPNYPDKTSEIKDTGSDAYKKAVPILLEKMKKQNKGREPRHRDKAGVEMDNYSYYLLIDENASPKERLFKANEETPKVGQEQTASEIPPEVVREKTKGYPEIKNAPSDVFKRALETFKKQQGRDMDNEETVTAFDSKDYEYVVLCDKSKKGSPYRVFKSPEPVPA